MPVRFDWEPDKATSNARRSGITFEEAVTVFADPLAQAIQDDDTIRLTSARRATSHERRRHEEGP